MPYKELTIEGKEFIKYYCKGSGNSNLSGAVKKKGNIIALPHSNADPKIWVSKAKGFNGEPILTNDALANALIWWFNSYSAEYGVDANIIAAQAYQESKYKVWNYHYDSVNGSSTASGITQFIATTFWDIVINTKSYTSVKAFNDAEIKLLTIGLEGDVRNVLSYAVSSNGNIKTTPESRALAIRNRAIVHQNITDNPGLLIKAQCRYMKYIAQQCNYSAACALLGYNRGSGYVINLKKYNKANNIDKMVYSDLINQIKNNSETGYVNEGTNYVEKIFGYLGDKDNKYISLDKAKGYWFGYKELGLDKPFDPQKSHSIEAIAKYSQPTP